MNIAGMGKRGDTFSQAGCDRRRNDRVMFKLLSSRQTQEIFNMRLGKMLSDISRATLLLFLFAREICFRTESQKFASYRQSTLL